ncbi:unnamed protein product [Nesidiocoris tenuis]|uniref:Uncharacterized protein n=1 Tax=Nesidiocoris tenuis TaxID=355587 RepID=A0A6H5HV79_9HEMI|nr:unnamed protein product [Nesidiocoris tenuis]
MKPAPDLVDVKQNVGYRTVSPACHRIRPQRRCVGLSSRPNALEAVEECLACVVNLGKTTQN